MTDRRFPDDFLFGAATAAHQIEGGNANSDWWEWEHAPGSPCKEPSGDACDFYHRYADDIALLARLGLDTFRLSIEWARIEPAEGEFSRAALEHYRRVLAACRELGVKPIVTFHHFTLPRWLGASGGLERPDFPALFERYCATAAAALGDLMHAACTINEPEVVSQFGYLAGTFPPGHHEDAAGLEHAVMNLLEAHRRSSAAIRQAAGVPVGITLATQELVYEAGVQPGDSQPERWARITDRFLQLARADDFVGVQTYTRAVIGPDGPQGRPSGWRGPADETPAITQMGYANAPEALGGTIRRAWRSAGVPVLVTENGLATAHDERRISFVRAALNAVLDCLAEGIDVRGYLYWSLLDNFEWAYGYDMTFGLVAVDRTTFERHPKPSAAWLGQVAKSRRLG